MPFLSLLDDRAKPKGSRDPLGFELVWTHFGRRVVGNLTTITSSLENFAVALLGFYWANELAENVAPEDNQKVVREYFLKYEQIAGYLRYYGKSKDIMGVTRISNRISNDKQKLPIGMAADEQILSDQTGYGLWGFYSNALKDTNLVDGNERKPTTLGVALAQKIEKTLDKDTFLSWIKGNNLNKDALKAVSSRYMKAIHKEEIITELFERLMNGGSKQLIQKDLWMVTNEIAKKQKLPSQIGSFIQSIKSYSNSSAVLISRLEDIEKVERVLVSINNIFSYCQRQNDIEFDKIIKELEKQHYDYGFLPINLPKEEFPRRDHIERILQYLRNDNYDSALKEIFSLNEQVMKQRNGASWLELENDGRVRVRVKNEKATLLSQVDGQLESEWDYDYFLGSYLAIARSQLETASG
jgi:hypothetical protein